MQGFERLREFNRAFQASHPLRTASLGSYELLQHELEFAEGMLCGVMLVLPFWLALACAIELLAH